MVKINPMNDKELEKIVTHILSIYRILNNSPIELREAVKVLDKSIQSLLKQAELRARTQELETYKWHQPNSGDMPDFDYINDRLAELEAEMENLS